MQDDQRYNGWKNYPTWAVALWIGNDQGLDAYARGQTDEVREMAPDASQVRDGIWTVDQATRFLLADVLRDWIREMVEMDEASLRSDLLGFALDEVDWHEVADAQLGY